MSMLLVSEVSMAKLY